MDALYFLKSRMAFIRFFHAESAKLVHPFLPLSAQGRRLFGQRLADRAPLRDPLEIAEQSG